MTLELSLIGATLSGDEAPSEAVLPELIVCFNLVPSFGGALETRSDLVQMEFAIGQEGWSASDALCAVWSIPETGATLFAMASGPRDTIGSPLGDDATFTCDVSGTILRASKCIATFVRPGWLVYIPGDPVTHEVVRLISVDACQIEAPPTVSGKRQVRFVAGFGREAAKAGLKVETIGAATIVGPSNPQGALPGARVNGPIAAVVEDEQSGASVPRWISIVRPGWPGLTHPGRCAGLAVDTAGRLVALMDDRVLVSENGGASFYELADLSAEGPLWLCRYTYCVVVGCFADGTGKIAILNNDGTLTTIEERQGEVPQFAAIELRSGVDHRLAVLWEREENGVLWAEVEFLAGDPPANVNNTQLSSHAVGADGLPFGVNGGNRPYQLAPGNGFVMLVTELGEVYKVSSVSGVTQVSGGSGNRTESTTAFRLDWDGPWYTKCALVTPLRKKPYFLSTDLGTKWACIMEDLTTFDAANNREVAGLYAYLFSAVGIQPLRNSGVPTHPLNPILLDEFARHQGWIDEHAQLLLDNYRIVGGLNYSTTQLVQNGHEWHFNDRGVTTGDTPAATLTRPVAGVVANMLVLDTGHVLDDADPPSVVADFSALGAPRAVASSGTEAVVVFTSAAKYYDGSTWNDIAAPPEAMVSGAWNGSAFIFLGGTGSVYAFVPGTGWSTVGTGVVGEAPVGVGSAPGYVIFVFPSGVDLVSGTTSVTVVPAPGPAPLSAGAFAYEAASWKIFAVDGDRKLYSSVAPYSSFSLLRTVPFSVCRLAGGTHGGMVLVPGLALPVPLSQYSQGYVSAVFWGFNGEGVFPPYQSGLAITYTGVPIVRPDGESAWYVCDVGQPRARFSAAAVSDGAVALWATHCPSGLFSIGDSATRQDETVVPGASGVGLIDGTTAVICTSGGIQKIQLGGAPVSVDADGAAVYTGGIGAQAFVVRASQTKIVSGASETTVATPPVTKAAAAFGRATLVGPSDVVMVSYDGSSASYTLPQGGVSNPIPVAGTIDPVILASKGAVTSRWRRPAPVQRLYVYRGGTGWQEVGPTGIDAAVAAFTGSRITIIGTSMADISAWGGGGFRPVSELFWSPVWAVSGGHLVLFGVTEIEEGRLVYHRRRIRWSAPLAPFDFDTLEASGIADLYPDTGDFLAAASLPSGIIYADEFGLGVLEPTFDPAAPFSHRRLADIPRVITQMVSVGSSVFFIAEDDWLWQANVAGAQRVRAIRFERVFGKLRYEIKPALFFVPSKGLIITDLNGSNRFLIVTLPEGRMAALALTRTAQDAISVFTAVDGTAIGEPVIFSANGRSSVAPRLLIESGETTGNDRIDSLERPWFISMMTPPVNQDIDISARGVELVGSSGIASSQLSALVLDEAEAIWDAPFSAQPVLKVADQLFRFARPLGNRWQTPMSGNITLWAPWWSGQLLDQDGAPVPFTPVSDNVVSVNVTAAGYIVFTGRPEFPIGNYATGVALDYSALAIASVDVDSTDPWQGIVAPDISGLSWFALALEAGAKGHWARRGGPVRLAERPRVLVFGRALEPFHLSSLRLDAVPRRLRGFAESA